MSTPLTGAEALRATTLSLTAAAIPDAARDARHLVAHAMGRSPDRLTLHLTDALLPAQIQALDRAIAARIARQPVSQITGQRAFWGRSFRVTPDVLDPRPETETLIEAALAVPFARVLDLGTGSGAILVTLLAERPEAFGLGTDLSLAALDVARANAATHAPRATFQQADWFAGLTGHFDLIVSNPPYIAAADVATLSPEVRDWEPHLALTPGPDGLEAYRAIAAGALAHLSPGGRLMVEIGPTQGAAVAALLSAAGLLALRILHDLDSRDRVVTATAP